DYDNPANANLIRVIERRRGLPVALGVLWLHAARAAGWPAHGVDFPAHFLIALEGAGGQLVIDVFEGGTVLDAPALRALIKRVAGPEAELRPGLLRSAGTRAVLLRLQNNIRTRRLGAGDMAGALAATRDMLRIAPDEGNLWREAGAIHQRLDQVTAALRCFERFLVLVPEGDVAARLRREIASLRARLN
ncbi:MAG: SirB1 family protein, partial [Acetobacteraceae bacterium]